MNYHCESCGRGMGIFPDGTAECYYCIKHDTVAERGKTLAQAQARVIEAAKELERVFASGDAWDRDKLEAVSGVRATVRALNELEGT